MENGVFSSYAVKNQVVVGSLKSHQWQTS